MHSLRMYLLMIALVLLALAGAAGTAAAQGKPDAQKAPAAGQQVAAPYFLYGDYSNSSGASTTLFSTSAATGFGWEFRQAAGTGITVRASGSSAGVQGEGSSFGLKGYSNPSGGIGVYGQGGHYGVFAHGDDAGVYAEGHYGVEGHSTSPFSAGVYGEGGARGSGVEGNAGAVGVKGFGSASDGIGVYGEGLKSGLYGYSQNGGSGIGVYGEGGPEGVHGRGSDKGVYGRGDNYGLYGYSDQIGVKGFTYGAIGVEGEGGKYGVHGVSSGYAGSNGYGGYFSATKGIGIYASTTGSAATYAGYFSATAAIGVYASSSSNYGLYASTKTGAFALRAVNPSKAAGKYAAVFDGNVRINGSYVATGTKSALVYTTQGDRLMYAEESTQNRFTDEGSGYLKDGVAVIKIDPLFAQTVSLGDGYHVFVTPRSADTLGLAVTDANASSFTVRELGKGKGSFSFDWHISAPRKGYEKERMALAAPDLPEAPIIDDIK